MDVLLINSPVKIVNRHSKLCPPLGLLYVASTLLKAGMSVNVQDFNINGLDLKKLETLITIGRPKILGISTLTETYPSSLKIARAAKALDPSIFTVLGGPHPSLMYKEALKNIEIDFAALGEGELTMLGLSQNILSGATDFSQIPGIAYKQDGVLRLNKQREFIKNPDSLPFPARSLLPFMEYECPATVLASRGGCPYRCRYCAVNNIWQGKRRFRQPELILEEISLIIKNGISREIIFVDDIFSLNRNFVINICKMIKQQTSLHFTWRCTTRVDLVDEPLLKIMSQSNCTGVTYGVESGSQRILEMMNKNVKLEQVRDAVKKSIANGLRVTCAFMFPHPEDTKLTIKEQIQFMKELSDLGAEISLSFTTPLPGTDYYDKAEELGIKILAKNWDEFDMSHLIITNKNLTFAELIELEEEMYNSVGLTRY